MRRDYCGPDKELAHNMSDSHSCITAANLYCHTDVDSGNYKTPNCYSQCQRLNR